MEIKLFAFPFLRIHITFTFKSFFFVEFNAGFVGSWQNPSGGIRTFNSRKSVW